MKRSTILFTVSIFLLMLIPLAMYLAMYIKIKNGNYIDMDAKEAAGYKKENYEGTLSEIVLNGKYKILQLDFVEDTVNYIRLDTTAAKYISYKIENGVLAIQYDFNKDNAENKLISNEEGEYNTERVISVHAKSIFKKIEANGTNISLKIKTDEYFSGDLDFYLKDASWVTHTMSDDIHIDRSVMISVPHKINMKLFNTEINANFSFVKELNIEMRNSTILNKEYESYLVKDFDHMDLTLDEDSHYETDVHLLKKMSIHYIK
ncbi:MAG TPA: hypothetical protein VNB90_14705 [Cytophagaceae bacterium]|nr:hypothetical protein [Cytophagaceae bacterium]